MHWVSYFLRRTFGNIRREPLLSGATILTVSVAFLCFSAFLALALGLEHVARSWSEDFHLSVYLRDGVTDQEVERFSQALGQLGPVSEVTVVPSEEMRERLIAGMGDDLSLANLEPRLFPTTVEVRVNKDVTDAATLAALSERVSGLALVEQVETYGDLYERLSTVTSLVRGLTIGLGVIVLLATLLVVGNTVRLSLMGCKEEIEIQKLCGATDRFVKTPFLLAGAFQGFVGAVLSLGLLALAVHLFFEGVGGLLPSMPGHGFCGLPIAALVSVVAGGTALGLLGSHVSVHRFLRSAP